MAKQDATNYERIVWLLYKRITGALTPEEKEELEEWRTASPINEESYRRLIDVGFLEQEFRRLSLVDAARPLQDMQARIRQDARPHRVLRWMSALAVAASLASVFFVGYFWDRAFDSAPAEPAGLSALPRIPAGTTQATLTLADGASIPLDGDTSRNARLIAARQPVEEARPVEEQINRLATPRGGEFRIMLEDSTEVWLNAESQLVYPENFTGDERRVAVSGEAYFKVAKDSLRPFYVESGGMEVRVYGTEFNIQSYEEAAHVYTTLVEGSIALKPLQGSQAELVLTPGHQAVSRTDDQATFVRPVNAAAVASWHKGRFSFEEQTLGQIMQTLSRWYAFEYEFADPSLESTVFKGSAPRYGDLAEVLSILEKSGGIAFGVEGEKIIITNNQTK